MYNFYDDFYAAHRQAVGKGNKKLLEEEYCYKDHEESFNRFFYDSKAANNRDLGYKAMLAQRECSFRWDDEEIAHLKEEHKIFLGGLGWHHIDAKGLYSEQQKRIDRIIELLNKD